jgi:hypothetical protein
VVVQDVPDKIGKENNKNILQTLETEGKKK